MDGTRKILCSFSRAALRETEKGRCQLLPGKAFRPKAGGDPACLGVPAGFHPLSTSTHTASAFSPVPGPEVHPVPPSLAPRPCLSAGMSPRGSDQG